MEGPAGVVVDGGAMGGGKAGGSSNVGAVVSCSSSASSSNLKRVREAVLRAVTDADKGVCMASNFAMAESATLLVFPLVLEVRCDERAV